MNYCIESLAFVNYAFDLLDTFKKDPSLCNPEMTKELIPPYVIRINSSGKLSLIKIETDEFGNETRETIAHSYNDKYSKITYIGKLLASYLEHLQMEW